MIFCFDKNNHIVALDWYSSGEAEELNSDFSDLLLKQIQELEERKNRMLERIEKQKKENKPCTDQTASNVNTTARNSKELETSSSFYFTTSS